ncbi:hypothetical protein [Acidihalobacter aeolianus]|nr:hypothetical protein [Acidihalobacter aeolianus]
METAKYRGLSASARALLLELSFQFKGGNNGDLGAGWALMRDRFGWRSPGTLARAKAELIGAGFITVARQGGRNRCSLYALTWQPIDDCLDRDGASKLDIKPTRTPLGTWRD